MNFTVKVHCGDLVFKRNFERWLEDEGLQVCTPAPFQLLIDRPLGWAVLEHSEVDYERCTVLSDNDCPTYQLDLLDKRPAALIHLADGEALLPTLQAVRAGRVVYPKVFSPLTKSERTTLRLVAEGYSNKEIASLRKLSENTVKNSLYDVYEKVDVKSRVQAAHYYYGFWHLLRNWTPPPDCR